MAKRRRISTRKKGALNLNKYHIGLALVVLGGLYFFSYYLASGSPVFDFLVKNASVAFGSIGLNIFFALSILVGFLVLWKGYLMKTLVKWFVLIMLLVSGILNFVIIDGTKEAWVEAGGYFSWPLILLLQNMFGEENHLAIKIFIIVLLVISLGWILYALNVKLPKLPKINMENYDKPEKRSDSKSFSSPRSSSQTNDDLLRKVNLSLEKSTSAPVVGVDSKATNSGSLLKDMLKKKVEEKSEQKKPKPMVHFSGDKPTFGYSLLESTQGQSQPIDEKFFVEKAKALQEKLLQFGVPITIEGFDIGPSIVQIKIKPEEGIRISAIEGLANDIKLSLKSKSLRIVAPIPGTDSVGIQIPNPKPMMVRLGDVFNTSEFQEAVKGSSTSLALGKGIDGSVEIKALESMPHLLVAGATGSGKSVGINDFILSLMFQNTPSELKFLMVDPKQIELEMYSGLPYMLAPIVHDSTKAIKLLKWTVEEMEKRYTTLKEKRVKNIDEYNSKVMGEKMYRIVFVIDEMADMMLSSSSNRKEVEDCINRLAAKARAAGIHLILATQRPSVNVITGLIKANIPTRIAFGVVSEVDSRTILGRKGAEDLVGKGDMLYMDPATKFPIRVQAPFVATEEIEKVVESLRRKYMQGLTEDDIYNPEIVAALASGGLETVGGSYSGGDDDDELVQRAIQVIAETRKASATLLQRKLGVGFARAARIMDILEEKGIIGPQDGAKPRDIFL